MAIFLTILATTGSITVIAGLSRHIYNKFFKAKPRRFGDRSNKLS